MKTTIFGIILTALLLISCRGDPKQKTEPIYLRQINTSSSMITKSSGSFFLLVGSYNSESKMTYRLQALGGINGEYRFLNLDMNHVSFKLDSSATTPYIVVEYERYEPYSNIVDNYDYLFVIRLNNERYVITCHPDLVPRQLSQVKI